MISFFFRRWLLFIISATATCAPLKSIQVTKPREQEASGDKLVTQSGVLYETKKVRLLTAPSPVCLVLLRAYSGVLSIDPGLSLLLGLVACKLHQVARSSAAITLL